MQIINYSKALSKQEKYQRFNELISMDYSSLKKEINGQMIGPSLIWARAQFDRKSNEVVQLNQWVKLTIEVFTKLKGDGIDVENLNIQFNEHFLDFNIEGKQLSRDNPIKLEKELYLDEQQLKNGEIVVLNSVILKLANKPIKFSLQPYLIAKDKI